MSSRRDKNRKIRRLKSKLAYFRSTLAEMKEAQSEYEAEWAKDSQDAIGILSGKTHSNSDQKGDDPDHVESKSVREFRVDPNHEKESDAKEKALEEENTLEKPEVPKWAKDLFRKIARRTHPDVNDNSDLIDHFRVATSSMEKQNYNALIDIALDLGLDPDIGQAEMAERLAKRIEKIKKEIDKIEKSFSWMWGESFGFDEIRANILRAFFVTSGIKIEESDLVELARSLSDS